MRAKQAAMLCGRTLLLGGALAGAEKRALSSVSGIERVGTSDPRMSGTVLHRKSGLVFISGQTAAENDGIRAQTEAVLQKVEERLAAAGTDKSHILQAQIWLKDIEADFNGMNSVWVDWVDPDNKPARATTQAPMARPAILVEIMVVAAAREGGGP